MSVQSMKQWGEDVDAIQMDYMKSTGPADDPDGADHYDGSGLCGISFLQGCCFSWT